MCEFDIAIIGSGPTATAALHGLSGSHRICVVTGGASSHAPASQLHPKIQAVAVERGEVPGVADPLTNAEDRGKPLFSTAAIGGLANYWGQQFVRFMVGDPWPNSLFSSYSDYEAECQLIESLFCVEGDAILRTELDGGFSARSPRLLTGAANSAVSGLGAMRQVFGVLEKNIGATVFDARVLRFQKAGSGWRVLLENGEAIIAQKVLLAGGLLGDARLLLRSYQDLTHARFKDHSPWMLYVLGLGKLFAARPVSARGHFNAITIDQNANGRCAVFASIYDMGCADLNLLLASTIGHTSALLRGWSAPPGASLIKPVQVWTMATLDAIEIDARAQLVAVVPRADYRPEADRALSATINMLMGLGGRTLKINRTPPGFGFHYHGLELRCDDQPYAPVTHLLRQRTGGGVACVDASILHTIGCRPHTLTAMATARRIAQKESAGTG